MDSELRQGIADGEQFAPDQQQVLASLQAGIKRRQFRRRTLLVSASAAAVVVVAIGAAVVMPASSGQPPATPPPSATSGSTAIAPSTSTATASSPLPMTSQRTTLPPTPTAVTEVPAPTSVASTPSTTAAVESRVPPRGINESDIAYELRLLLTAVGITDRTGDDNTGPSAELYGTWEGRVVRIQQALPNLPESDDEIIDHLEIAAIPIEVLDVQHKGLSVRFSCQNYVYEVQAYGGTEFVQPGVPDLQRTRALTAILLEHLDCP